MAAAHRTRVDTKLNEAHAAFVETGVPPQLVRDVVADSWRRSAQAGVDAEAGLAPISVQSDELLAMRRSHPLSPVFPVLYDVLGRAAEECDSVMAIADAEGRLLWVCGRPGQLRRAENIHFVEGAMWDERHAGTNAPGTALRLDVAVQIHAAEHYARQVHPWSCTAAPIHDPQTQAILGIVDITGADAVASPQVKGMVRAAARMAEAELGRLRLLGRIPDGPGSFAVAGSAADAVLRIDGLGRPDCEVNISERSLRLSRRHSEIAVILVDHPDGLSADQLALELYEQDVTSSTIRAETARLRAVLGSDLLDSRPYRLRVRPECDWLEVTDHLRAGRIREAARAYRGPLLPQSDAPGVITRRDRLERQLRAAIIASNDADLMVAWTQTRWGGDDREMWRRQAVTLPPSSPLRALAAAEARRLDVELGVVTTGHLARMPAPRSRGADPRVPLARSVGPYRSLLTGPFARSAVAPHPARA